MNVSMSHFMSYRLIVIDGRLLSCSSLNEVVKAELRRRHLDCPAGNL